MRRIEIDMLQRYREASQSATGMSAHALRKALGRTLIHCHVLTAHIAQWTEHASEAANLPYPLRHYFAGPQIKVCMRCHLDRPGSRPALERSDPHPYTYICAGCHDDVSREFPADLEVQMDRWPDRVREARVIQQALGRASILNASQTVLHRLSGVSPELPNPAAEKASRLTAVAPPPAPDANESTGVLTVGGAGQPESDYVAALFD